jgi:ribosomal-protein-alanine N-acetyltransferase
MSIMPQDKCLLRKMVKEDLTAVLQIETATQGAPWTEETFKTVFEHAYEGWVLQVEDHVVGYIVISMQVDECHILNLCIAHPFQRQGYGRKLLEYGLEMARKRNLAIAYLEVRRSNVRAIALYTRLNFRLIGERKEYYQTVNGPEDALVYAVSLKDIQA